MKKDHTMISIIIPIYNTPAACLRRCLDSIREQPYKDYELLLINDGSQPALSDTYAALAAEYHAQIYSQTNAGVSAARNLGIEYSSGDYLTFIDADDIILPDYLPHAAALARKSNYDIIIGSIQDTEKHFNQSFTASEVILDQSNITELESALLGGIGHDFICNQSIFYLLGSSCGRLYKSALLENVRYQTGLRYSEDQLFNRLLFQKAESAVIVPEYWYIYTQNPFSAMHGAYDTYLAQMKHFWDLWNNITLQETDPVLIRNAHILSLRWYNGFVSGWIMPCNDSFSQKRSRMTELAKAPIFVTAVGSLSFNAIPDLRNRLTYLLLKHHLYTSIFLINHFNKILTRISNS